MTFEELLAKVKGIMENVDISSVDTLAVQVNIKDISDGVFYIEVKDGKFAVEPYEYNDRDCDIKMSMANFNKLIDGKLDPVAAFTLGKLKVGGDIGKALEFSKLIKK